MFTITAAVVQPVCYFWQSLRSKEFFKVNKRIIVDFLINILQLNSIGIFYRVPANNKLLML